MTRFNLFDSIALLCILMIASIGIILIYSATVDQPGLSKLWIKQAIWISLGLFIYIILSRWDYHSILDHSGWLYVAGVLALILVFFFGVKINGARSWFRLPFMSLQPSELVKFTTILYLTKFFSRFQERHSSLMEFFGSSILVGIPFSLILIQPDMGTAFLFIPLFLMSNFLIGNNEILWATGLGTLAVILLISMVIFKPDWVFFLKDYQKARIATFVFPEKDVSNRGYQVHQAKISIGQGGLFGQGLRKGKQTKYGFLPAQHNDFILAVAAEELGFIGIIVIFFLFMILFFRSCATALHAPDGTGSILVILVLSTFTVQTLYNSGMMVGLVPTTGIPCPLLSYGGSSAISTLAMLGLIQSVNTHRYVN